jgi:ubiquinone/menaquinone biosynthesis C-methylase UbiE
VDILSKLKQREKQILKDTDQYNLAAEYYFKKKENDRYLREKPFVLSKSDFEVQVRFALLIDALDISIADTVLDFGAGTCWTSALLNRMGVRTISLDVSRTALKIGKEEVFQFDKRQKMELNPSFIAYNGRRIPLVDGSVDRILCFEAFHHIPNQQEILNEMYRVLRNGGKA